LIESTNEVTDFYSNPYADSEVAFLYLTTIKENQEKFREMIKMITGYVVVIALIQQRIINV
jgi:hypothetical protein